MLLADISGYTAFLGTVATAHPEMVRPGGPVPPAYAVMSSLLDIVVERIAPAFALAEIEGDAVFAYALDEPPRVEGGEALLRIVRSAHDGFRERIDEAMVVHKHDCQACIILPSLELKFVLHHGNFVIQPIAGQARLLGPTVILGHRLAAAARLNLAPEVGLAHAERYPDVGAVVGRVIGLSSAPSQQAR